MPAAFVGAFVLAFIAASLLWGVADAFAQPAETPTPTETGERPPYGYAPPSDDMDNGSADDAIDKDAVKDAASKGAPGDDIKAQGPGTSPAGDATHGHHGDVTQHWNWFGIHYGKDLAGGKYGDGQNFDPKTGKSVAGAEEPMSAAITFMFLNFVLLMALLVKFGKPAARKLAAERHDQIKSALDEAAKLRKQAQDKLTEYEVKLKDADSEIRKLVEGMRADAEADKARILANAAAQSAQMKKDAELRIAAEIENARALLTREVTAAAATATEKLLREKMLVADQQALVGTFINDLKVEPAATAAKDRS
ncbi:MAG: ATP synthase F0 subunit B [Deltaproteobacteria bacterium]|nr:ATP synthase F0 subunit B [Deltaproteobacteria bacterium]